MRAVGAWRRRAVLQICYKLHIVHTLVAGCAGTVTIHAAVTMHLHVWFGCLCLSLSIHSRGLADCESKPEPQPMFARMHQHYLMNREGA